MSKVEIDFNNIKYNLYEILNVKPDADDVKIKKSFMKIIKNFHPDKNSDLEEEIYYHLILANQILLNKESRKKYNEFLEGSALTFEEMKSGFNKAVKDISSFFPEESASATTFKSKVEELNKKHGYDETMSAASVIERFNKAKQGRDTFEYKIEKEDIKNEKDFNKKFEQNKVEGKLKDQIIEYKQNSDLSTYVVGDNYTYINDINKLYLEDSVQTNRFTSLDRAYGLQPVIQSSGTNLSMEDRMKEYTSMTNSYKNMKPTEFTQKKFDEW